MVNQYEEDPIQSGWMSSQTGVVWNNTDWQSRLKRALFGGTD